MTLFEKTLPKKVIAAIDRYRASHGIRSRAKALEEMVLHLAPEENEHPLEVALRNAPKLPKGSVPKAILEQMQAAENEPRVSLEAMLKRRKLSRRAP